MEVLTLGPVALSVSRLAAIAGVLAALAWARWRGGPERHVIALALGRAAAAGLLAARAGYVATHLAFYREAPWRALLPWEDGWLWSAGVLAALAVGVERLRARGLPARRLAAPVAAGLVAWVASAWLLGVGPPGLGTSRPGMGAAARADALPRVTLPDLRGEPVSLDRFRGGPVVVNLWATWCPPCRREMPVLAAAQQAYADVQFVFVNQREPPATVAAWIARSGLRLDNVVLDTRGDAFAGLAPAALPVTLFFDAQGRLADLRVGALSAAGLDDRLRALRRDAPAPDSKS